MESVSYEDRDESNELTLTEESMQQDNDEAAAAMMFLSKQIWQYGK